MTMISTLSKGFEQARKDYIGKFGKDKMYYILFQNKLYKCNGVHKRIKSIFKCKDCSKLLDNIKV